MTDGSGTPAAPLTFAIVGCGNVARTHARALAGLAARGGATAARLVACVDVVGSRARTLADEHGAQARSWGDVLADPAVEAVSVCTPSGGHAALAVQALAAGKHVVVEKPVDVTLAAARDLAAAARRSGRTVAVVSQHRFDDATAHVEHLVATGALGVPVLVDARVPWWRDPAYYAADAWRGTVDGDGGGALVNQAIHTVDLMLATAGPVARVQAAAATRLHDIEVEDVVCATLTFTSGALGTLAASTAVAPGFPARLALHGTAGSVVVEGDRVVVDARLGEVPSPRAEVTADALAVAGTGSRTAEHEVAGGWGVAHERQLADVVRAVREGRPPRVGVEDGIRALEVVDAVYRSARSGSPVDLT
ncbi:Gfo/Idh/MocA family protein [Cellulomonas iranensis]|uniref:Gfo/Idh/MocA family protein n=1 Tax=Cellulomonas iranensis TaxID=76862 RepID=UPI0013CFE88D|nr:Gfo/Idh/MocA family oxidoreductase [Cellulomonas iranensis]